MWLKLDLNIDWWEESVRKWPEYAAGMLLLNTLKRMQSDKSPISYSHENCKACMHLAPGGNNTAPSSSQHQRVQLHAGTAAKHSIFL
jgi:hypothetical protein